MIEIRALTAKEILDSRGEPTVEVTLTTSTVRSVASVPAGRSTGAHEAHELRDGEARFSGRGVRRAVAHVGGEIAGAVVGKEFDQRALDEALIQLDGTTQKSRLGANALLGVSLAFARASAHEEGVPLWRSIAALAQTTPSMPQPCYNVINGGAHVGSGLALQEFMIVPLRGDIAEKNEQAAAVIEKLRTRLIEQGLSVGVGDEGGFAPTLTSTEAALDLLVSAGVSLDQGIAIALDAAANHFYQSGRYHLESGTALSAEALMHWYEGLVLRYPICSIEDPFEEASWDAFADLVRAIGDKVHIVGDDLLATNAARIAIAAEKRAVNTVLLKPNQIGTLSETIDAAAVARRAGFHLFASHRSGETNDDYIADLAVGLGCDFIKAGSLTRGERVAKYNRLVAIAEELHA